ncbi:MAG TPA: gamma-glutamyltransferase, partial [Bryobacteraceae bacterium]
MRQGTPAEPPQPGEDRDTLLHERTLADLFTNLNGGIMDRKSSWTIVTLLTIASAHAQVPAAGGRGASEGAARTMKTLARGADFAAASMMPQATLTEERVLRAGGNAFDAVVAGQAVLGVVQPSANGMGSDAVLLVYDAKAKKVFSINAEGTAPKLATMEWYKAHNGGKLPVDDSLLAGTVPGVVDAWYILLSRWGTKNFAELLAPAIELTERGVPVSRGALSSRGFLKYPTSMRVYGPPEGQSWQDGQMW